MSNYVILKCNFVLEIILLIIFHKIEYKSSSKNLRYFSYFELLFNTKYLVLFLIKYDVRITKKLPSYNVCVNSGQTIPLIPGKVYQLQRANLTTLLANFQ